MTFYVPLRVRSNYSLLSGASSIDDLLRRAEEIGLSTLALTDENNLYGAIAFFRKARARGLRPILGSLLTHAGREAVLLVRDRTGYSNLCEIISARHLDRRFDIVRAIAERQDGLFILTPDPILATNLAAHLPPNRLWIELLRPCPDPAVEVARLDAASQLGLGVAASADVFFSEPSAFRLHEMLCAMREKRPLHEVRPMVAGHRSGFLRAPSEFDLLFLDRPDAVIAVNCIAEQCDFELLGSAPVFPRLAGDSGAALMAAARSGALSRYGVLSAPILARLEREHALIERKGFADYFLIVADIVRDARAMGTPVAGRGSGAGSLVAYALGITNVDPLRYGLSFERFLNEGRSDYPDLDIDFCWRLRDRLIRRVFKRYGPDRVAMISTMACMRPSLAFREAARVLGIEPVLVGRILYALRHGLGPEHWRVSAEVADAAREALDAAWLLEGFPHHVSVHCGGVVITPGLLMRHAPLERTAKGIVVTQYDKDAAEAVGLIKLDLLGNRSLSAMAEAARIAARSGARRPDPESVSERDPAVARLLAKGDTVGINQLESPAMRQLLRQLRPDNVDKLMQALALIRPGTAALGMKDEFIRRCRGLAPTPPLDSRVAPLLQATHGIMLYEDDPLAVVAALAGLPAPEADRFRRAVAKCGSDLERRRLAASFLSQSAANGAPRALAEEIWVQMAKFNAYSFCRAHAAGYARLAWTNAYMKAHHPLAFWVGALNNNQSMYGTWVYVEEAKRGGIEFLGPCVNRSGLEFTAESERVRVGLGRVRGLTSAGIRAILALRPFTGLSDLSTRAMLRPVELESLILAGALDFAGRSRPDLLLQAYCARHSSIESAGRHDLFQQPEPECQGLLGDFTAARKCADEWRLLGFSLGSHPAASIRECSRPSDCITSGMLAGRVGCRARLCGIPAAVRPVRAKSGGRMCFLTLSDEDGLFEAVLFPDTYERHSAALACGGATPLMIEGKVESQYGAPSVTVFDLRPLETLGKAWPDARKSGMASTHPPSEPVAYALSGCRGIAKDSLLI